MYTWKIQAGRLMTAVGLCSMPVIAGSCDFSSLSFGHTILLSILAASVLLVGRFLLSWGKRQRWEAMAFAQLRRTLAEEEKKQSDYHRAA